MLGEVGGGRVAWSPFGTTHHRVAVNDKVLEVRAVQRRPLAERW